MHMRLLSVDNTRPRTGRIVTLLTTVHRQHEAVIAEESNQRKAFELRATSSPTTVPLL